MSERVHDYALERVRGFFLGLLAPLVLLFGIIIALPDVFRYWRMRNM
jgi:hypothetical protein